MPRTTDFTKYPADFLLLLDKAQAGPVVIPDPSPAGLRGYIQAFLRACEAQGPESPISIKAKGIQATGHPGDPSSSDESRRSPYVLVQRRSDSIYAKRVAAALGTSIDAQADKAARDFASRF